MQRKRKGFTLVELVIVIAVIAVLSAVLIPTFSGVINNANEAKDKANAKTMTTELMLNATLDGVGYYTPTEVRSVIKQKTNANSNAQSKGNSFWYNAQTNSIEVQNTKQMIVGEQKGAGLLTAYADGGTTVNFGGSVCIPSLLNNSLVYICGNPILDEVIDVLSNLTLYAKLSGSNIKTAMTDLYNQALAKISTENFSQEEVDILKAIIEKYKPDNCLYFDNAGIYTTQTTSNKLFANYVITDGTTRIAAMADGESQKINAESLYFPAGCCVTANSFNGLSANDGKKIIVIIPAANSVTQYTVKQFVENMVGYAVENNKQDNLKNCFKDLYDLYNTNDFENVSFSDSQSVLTKVEEVISKQTSTVAKVDGFDIQTGVVNKAQYEYISFAWQYYQSELRVLLGNKESVYSKGSTLTTTNEGIGLNDALGFKKLSGTLSQTALQGGTTSALKTAYSVANGADVVSEYLIPSLQIEMNEIYNSLKAKQIDLNQNGTIQLGEHDVIQLYYKNYDNYGVLSGVCVFYITDGNGVQTPISYRINPAMYVKRVSAAKIASDMVEGAINVTYISVPDLSESVNMNQMKVFGLVGSNQVELEKVTDRNSIYKGKYRLPSNMQGEIDEVIIKDNNNTVVFRQFV